LKLSFSAILVVLLVAGCTKGTTLETFTMPQGHSAGGGLVTGDLVGNGECVQLSRPGEPLVALVWEDTYTATFPPLRIYDSTGGLVASGGQPVWLGVEGNHKTSNSSCSTTKAYWVFSITTTDPINATP